MTAERFYQLITRYQTGELSPGEWKEFSAILSGETYKDWINADIQDSFDKMESNVLWDNDLRNEIWAGIETQTIASSRRRIRLLTKSWVRYAAAILLLVAGAITWRLMKSPAPAGTVKNNGGLIQQDVLPGGDKAVLTLADGTKITLDDAAKGYVTRQGGTTISKQDSGQLTYTAGKTVPDGSLYNTISTPRGGQYRIVLPDGSKAWLNALSSIKFPATFTGAGRNVVVTGEVYLEVARNIMQPFVVSTNTANIEVLGTSFDVNAYEDEERLKTTLVSGAVRVSVSAGGTTPAVLKPGQQAELTPDAHLTVHSTDIGQAIAWKNGMFQFNQTPLQDAMRQLSRWYDVDVVYPGGKPDIRFSGDMKRDLNLSQVLEALSEMGVKFKIEGKKLIVMQ
jgi:ferric-dicitrate binding protein FerR (iron transport regulator)